MFKSTLNKGFHLTFSNGGHISVQFGTGNYCDNRSMYFDKPHTGHLGDEVTTCSNAEIMITNSKGEAITHHFIDCQDQVEGYLTCDKVGEIIGKLQAFSKEDLGRLRPFNFED